MKSNKLFSYAGTKDKFLQQLLVIIDKSSATIFHEPFLGSGAVFLNIEDRFDEYHLSDIQPAIVNAFNTVKHTTYNDYLDFTKMIKSVYGDIKQSKQSYYDFRNNYANVEFEKNFESIESGFSQLVLFSSCINSLARWNGYLIKTSLPPWSTRHRLLDSRRIAMTIRFLNCPDLAPSFIMTMLASVALGDLTLDDAIGVYMSGSEL
jgi:hypothetical protein